MYDIVHIICVSVYSYLGSNLGWRVTVDCLCGMLLSVHKPQHNTGWKFTRVQKVNSTSSAKFETHSCDV